MSFRLIPGRLYRNLIVFTVCILMVSGYSQTLNFKNYNIDDGLVQSQVFCILQDKEGYLWFGTANGLSRFDGLHFTNYNRQDGLADIYVTASYADENGDLWFGHGNGKVTRFDWEKRRFEQLSVSRDPSGWSSSTITKILKGRNGTYWFTTLGEGVFGYSADTLIHLDSGNGLTGDNVFAVIETSAGSLWFGTREGITIYRPNPEPGQPPFDSLTVEDGLPTNFIISLLQDNLGNVWIGTRGKGLTRYRPAQSSPAPGDFTVFTTEHGLAHSWITALYQDRAGQIWAGTFDGGVSKYIPGEEKSDKGYFRSYTTDNGLSSNFVLSIFEDREGNKWFGTNGGGVNRFRDQGYEIYSVKEGLIEKVVWNIHQDRFGNVWFGSDRGITKYMPGGQKAKASVKNITSAGSIPVKLIHDIFEDSKGNLWALSFGNALIRINPQTDAIRAITAEEGLPSSSLTAVQEDERGNLWLGTFNEGIIKYSPERSTFRQYRTIDEKPIDTIRDIFRDQSGDLWFGMTKGGVIHYDGEEFRRYSKKNGYGIPSAVSMDQDSSGMLWIVTYKGELITFDGKHVYNYSRLDGLSKAYFYSVVCRGEDIWLGTNRGIAKFNSRDSSFTRLGKEEGYPALETNENAVYKDSHGCLWFGTIGGAVKIMPHRFRSNLASPPVKITGLKLFLKEDSFPQNNSFPHDQNYLTFQFQGICLTAPLKLTYRYKLEGFDREWSPMSRENFATYSNLPPGQYAFKVKAQNNDGVWSRQPAVYEFTIKAPFWQTWWFDSLMVLLIIAGILGAYKLRVRKIEKYRALLESRVNERTGQLMAEKERAEAAYHALSESEEKFRAFTETTSSAIFIYQGNHFKYVNRETEVVTGYSRDEMLSMKFWDIVAPEFRNLIRERGLARQRGENVPTRYEFKIITKSGEERWIDFTARAIELEGAPAGLGTAVDITERKQAEQALSEQKERLAVTLRSIGDGVITTDTGGRIVLMNQIAEELTGFSFKQAKEKRLHTVFKIINHKTGKRTRNPVNKVLKTGKVMGLDQDAALLRRDESKKLISCSAAPIRDGGGRIIGTVLVFRDITERKRLEEELLKVQKLESVGLLAGGIAHDFNNILTAILGNISVARMQVQVGDEACNRLNDAEKACFQARDLTQQLLTFSRGGVPVKETAHIGEIIKDSAEFTLRGSSVQCEYNLPDDLWAVKVDTGQISQVIQNLVINAKQAMPRGGKIHLTARNFKINQKTGLPVKAGSYIRISIRDEGIGIAREHLDKVFDPYFTTKQQGNGLGLATAYSIIKRHDGHIHVESEMGIGTTFYLFLPSAGEAHPPAQKREEVMVKNTGRILLMDDEEMVREVVSSVLKELGYEVELASEGEEALKKYRESLNNSAPFDVVIMDLTIPGGMGGETAIRKLLEMDPAATAVVASGYSNDAVMAEYKAYGFKGCIKKPFNVDEISRVLAQLIREAGPANNTDRGASRKRTGH